MTSTPSASAGEPEPASVGPVDTRSPSGRRTLAPPESAWGPNDPRWESAKSSYPPPRRWLHPIKSWKFRFSDWGRRYRTGMAPNVQNPKAAAKFFVHRIGQIVSNHPIWSAVLVAPLATAFVMGFWASPGVVPLLLGVAILVSAAAVPFARGSTVKVERAHPHWDPRTADRSRPDPAGDGRDVGTGSEQGYNAGRPAAPGVYVPGMYNAPTHSQPSGGSALAELESGAALRRAREATDAMIGDSSIGDDLAGGQRRRSSTADAMGEPAPSTGSPLGGEGEVELGTTAQRRAGQGKTYGGAGAARVGNPGTDGPGLGRDGGRTTG